LVAIEQGQLVDVDNLHGTKAAAPRSSPGALHLLFMTRPQIVG
jgi:hypothetical protein